MLYLYVTYIDLDTTVIDRYPLYFTYGNDSIEVLSILDTYKMRGIILLSASVQLPF